MDQNRTAGTRCPDWGCCCDHGRECCAGAAAGGGNYDHLGKRGGCKKLTVCPRGYISAAPEGGGRCALYPDHCDGCIWKWIAAGV